jgi:cytoskeleton protein RodZ
LAYGVGAALRNERVRRNVAIAEISSQTKISARFLSAIEEEEFERLPGTVFTRNFVRQYALALDLDPDPLLAQLPKADTRDPSMSALPVRARVPAWDPRWNPAIASIAWLLLAAVAAVAAYVHFNRPAATGSGRARAVEQSPPKREEKPMVATPVPASVPTPSAPTHPVQVVLTAREESWVQVTADGKLAFSETLQPNDSRSVAADDQVKLMTGNAGGLAISLNGRTLDPLGRSGEVRTVRLTAEGPQQVQKIQPPPDPL